MDTSIKDLALGPILEDVVYEWNGEIIRRVDWSFGGLQGERTEIRRERHILYNGRLLCIISFQEYTESYTGLLMLDVKHGRFSGERYCIPFEMGKVLASRESTANDFSRAQLCNVINSLMN